MRYNEVGINLDSIDKLILDIYNYAERVNKTLNQISDVVDQTKNFYACESADNYRNKFNSFGLNLKLNLISNLEIDKLYDGQVCIFTFTYDNKFDYSITI